jgi:hypothetical protein
MCALGLRRRTPAVVARELGSGSRAPGCPRGCGKVGTRGRYAYGHCGRKDAGLQAVVATSAMAAKKAGRYETAPQKMSQQRVPSLSPSLSFSSISVASTPPLSSASSTRSLSGSPVPGKIVGASKDDGVARGCRLAVRSCADLRSMPADALRTRKDLKAERRRQARHIGAIELQRRRLC